MKKLVVVALVACAIPAFAGAGNINMISRAQKLSAASRDNAGTAAMPKADRNDRSMSRVGADTSKRTQVERSDDHREATR